MTIPLNPLTPQYFSSWVWNTYAGTSKTPDGKLGHRGQYADSKQPIPQDLIPLKWETALHKSRMSPGIPGLQPPQKPQLLNKSTSFLSVPRGHLITSFEAKDRKLVLMPIPRPLSSMLVSGLACWQESHVLYGWSEGRGLETAQPALVKGRVNCRDWYSAEQLIEPATAAASVSL